MRFLKLIILISLIPLPSFADTNNKHSKSNVTSFLPIRVSDTSYSRASRDRNINKIYSLYKDKRVRKSYFLKEYNYPL